MTKRKLKIVANDKQLSLLDLLTKEKEERTANHAGRLNISARVIAALKQAIRQAPKSRDNIVDEMTDMLGVEITLGMINNWTSPSHPHRIPAEFVHAFCRATGSNEMIRILSEMTGVFTIPGPDALRAEIHKLEEESRKLQKERQKRLLFLKEMGCEP